VRIVWGRSLRVTPSAAPIVWRGPGQAMDHLRADGRREERPRCLTTSSASWAHWRESSWASCWRVAASTGSGSAQSDTRARRNSSLVEKRSGGTRPIVFARCTSGIHSTATSTWSLERLALALEGVRTVFPRRAAALADEFGEATRKMAHIATPKPADPKAAAPTGEPTVGERYAEARRRFTDEARPLIAPTGTEWLRLPRRHPKQ
jgi:hypothetical protein